METVITLGSIFGNLDQSARTVQLARENLMKILSNPERRLRKGDIERAERYLKSIVPEVKQIKVALKEFKAVAV